ncbi:radical SAM/SPASM domain-containing protein [Saccharicrinis sp. GN24d3]|uniref:radical SAM/SPASM domain-containing protein n=1 Tax=Saccharicrinis sp. GN24d3 TaxID=3458416 RepID=UPI004036EF03
MPKLYRITLDTNPEDCNLKCIMCEEHSRYSNFKNELYDSTGVKARRMPSNWIDKIFQEAKELDVKEIIPSTMGEPLLYKDIDKFFQLAEKYDIKINLTTNGTFPKRDVTEWAELILPVTSDTKISLNGVTKDLAESIMQGIHFEQHVSNLKAFIECRDLHYRKSGFYSRITLQLTFMQKNMHQLPEIIKLGASMGVDRIKGHHLWTHFEEIKDLSFKTNKESIALWNSIVDKANDAAETYRKPNGEKVLLEQIDYLNEKETSLIPESYACPFLGKELWVSATGKISPCCAPDKERDSLGDFGNYKNRTFKEVLNSSIYNDLITNYKQKPLCQACVMRKPL